MLRQCCDGTGGAAVGETMEPEWSQNTILLVSTQADISVITQYSVRAHFARYFSGVQINSRKSQSHKA